MALDHPTLGMCHQSIACGERENPTRVLFDWGIFMAHQHQTFNLLSRQFYSSGVLIRQFAISSCKQYQDYEIAEAQSNVLFA